MVDDHSRVDVGLEEERVYEVQDWAEVHRLFHREGLAIAKIAERLGMSRNTVMRLLARPVPRSECRRAPGRDRTRRACSDKSVEHQLRRGTTRGSQRCLVQAGTGSDGGWWTGRLLTDPFHAISQTVKDTAIDGLGLHPDRVTVVERGRDEKAPRSPIHRTKGGSAECPRCRGPSPHFRWTS